MADALLVVMLVAATLYAVLAGADFGIGMIEPLLDPEQERDVDEALLPVWEANHVWLVLVVVLAFVGFPPLFVIASTYLHIPLFLSLLGIVARGSAFAFRHYDPAAGPGWRRGYSWWFRAGSALTPLFLGVSLAACLQGRLGADSTRGAYAAFIAPWNTPFCWATGVFTCTLFAFQGAALLAAERCRGPEPLPLLKLARALHLAAIAAGALVFALAFWLDVPWFNGFFHRPSGITSLAVATALIPAVAYAFRRGRPWLLRLSVGAQVASVLFGVFATEYPVLLRLEHGALTIADAAAPASTLEGLAVAVAVGLALILPSLVYLLRVYKVPSR